LKINYSLNANLELKDWRLQCKEEEHIVKIGNLKIVDLSHQHRDLTTTTKAKTKKATTKQQQLKRNYKNNNETTKQQQQQQQKLKFLRSSKSLVSVGLTCVVPCVLQNVNLLDLFLY